MEWLQQNWFWVVVFILFVAAHLFGHGGHGGGHTDDRDRPRRREKENEGNEMKRPSGHQH